MPRLTVVLTGDGDDAAREHSRGSAAPHDVRDTTDDTDAEYVAFLPVGDDAAPGGYAALVGSLDESGSDVAVGRAEPSTASRPDPFARGRTRTDVEDLPALLTSVAPGAAVWRRARWQAHTPAGTPPTVAAGRAALGLARADSVDVLPEVVLHRRRSPDARVRTPRAADLAAMADRLDSALAVSRELGGRGRSAAKRAWVDAVVSGDLRWALSQLTEADDETQARIVATAGAFLVDAGPDVEASQRAVHRLEMHLARRGLLPQLVEVVKAERTGELAHTRAVRRGLAYYGDYPFREDRELRVPREVYRLRRELALRSRVDDVRWEGDALVVEGFAYVAWLDVASSRAGRLWLSLVPHDGRRPIRLDVERRERPDVTADAKESAYSYDWSGFRTTIPLAALTSGRPGGASTTWRLRATVLRGGVRRRTFVTATAPGAARRAPLRDLPDGSRVAPATDTGDFAVTVDHLPAVVDRIGIEGPDLILAGRVRAPMTEPALLEIDASPAAGPVTVLAAPVGAVFTARLPLDAVPERPSGADLVGADGARLTLRAATDLEPVRVARADGRQVRLARTAAGRLRVAATTGEPELVSVSWPEGSGLVLRVRDLGDATLVARAAAARREVGIPTRASDSGHVASLDPARVPSIAGNLPLGHATWQLAVRRPGSPDVQPLAVDPAAAATLPVRRTVGAKTFTVREVGGVLELVAGPDLRDDERGAANQRRLQRVEFPAFLSQGLLDEVLFESYQSRTYADNARAVYEELARRDTGLRCRWVVLDGQSELPEGLEPVRHNSREHYAALARSRFVVVPNYRPLRDWFRTPDGQVVVQTWHGAPFKRIGFDNERGERASSHSYHEMLLRESARWDYLLSPSPPATPILRQAFGYEGAMLETGYPRTDVFFRTDRDEIAARVRSRLGLPDGKKVVLYAPTMRDDLRYGGNRFSLDLQLDLDKARAELGDDHVLLVRRHAKVVDDVAGADGEFARDVSLWPDVNELLLATDVLVTDYSSLMFDFANTGRPMLFFTYDLDDYRDRLRGFYFDVERVPGPLLRTSDDVIAAIRDADALRIAHDSTYRAFVADFCAWDDGGAAARFVDEVFSGH